MKVFTKIYDASDLREWAINSGWCLEHTIKRLDETDNWELALSYIDELELSETQLNDFLRFEVDNILDEEEEEEEEDEEDEEERFKSMLLKELLDE